MGKDAQDELVPPSLILALGQRGAAATPVLAEATLDMAALIIENPKKVLARKHALHVGHETLRLGGVSGDLSVQRDTYIQFRGLALPASGESASSIQH